MKVSLPLAVLFATLCCCYLVQASTYLSFSSALDFENQYELDKLTPTTGDRSTITTYPNYVSIGGVLPNQCGVDPNNKLYYITAINMTGGIESYVYSFDSSSGVKKAQLTVKQTPVMTLEVDSQNGNVYGAIVNNKTDTIAQFDVKANQITPLVTFQRFDFVQVGVSTYCSKGKVFFQPIQGDKGAPIIVKADMKKNAVVARMNVDYLINTIEVNEGALYATWFNTNNMQNELVELDIQSGKTVRTIATLTQYPQIAGGSVLDASVGKKGTYIVAVADITNQVYIANVDIDSGSVQMTKALNFAPLCINQV